MFSALRGDVLEFVAKRNVGMSSLEDLALRAYWPSVHAVVVVLRKKIESGWKRAMLVDIKRSSHGAQ